VSRQGCPVILAGGRNFEFNIHGTVHRSMTGSNNQQDAAQ